MGTYLMDTNAVSDYFKDKFPEAAINFMDGVIDEKPILSLITKIELLCWEVAIDVENNVKDFINSSIILEISPKVIEYWIQIRRVTKIKLPDAIIAATALTHNITLITNNEKDFMRIEGLKILNPYKL